MELRTTERNSSRGVLVPVKTSRESRAGVLAAQLLCVSPEAAISSGQAVSRATGPAQGTVCPSRWPWAVTLSPLLPGVWGSMSSRTLPLTFTPSLAACLSLTRPLPPGHQQTCPLPSWSPPQGRACPARTFELPTGLPLWLTLCQKHKQHSSPSDTQGHMCMV